MLLLLKAKEDERLRSKQHKAPRNPRETKRSRQKQLSNNTKALAPKNTKHTMHLSALIKKDVSLHLQPQNSTRKVLFLLQRATQTTDAAQSYHFTNPHHPTMQPNPATQ